MFWTDLLDCNRNFKELYIENDAKLKYGVVSQRWKITWYGLYAVNSWSLFGLSSFPVDVECNAAKQLWGGEAATGLGLSSVCALPLSLVRFYSPGGDLPFPSGPAAKIESLAAQSITEELGAFHRVYSP
jgi:hypothetical protein